MCASLPAPSVPDGVQQEAEHVQAQGGNLGGLFCPRLATSFATEM